MVDFVRVKKGFGREHPCGVVMALSHFGNRSREINLSLTPTQWRFHGWASVQDVISKGQIRDRFLVSGHGGARRHVLVKRNGGDAGGHVIVSPHEIPWEDHGALRERGGGLDRRKDMVCPNASKQTVP